MKFNWIRHMTTDDEKQLKTNDSGATGNENRVVEPALDFFSRGVYLLVVVAMVLQVVWILWLEGFFYL